MRRREFAKLVAAMISWPMMASAQKPMPVVGFLASATLGRFAPYVAAFRDGLSGVSGKWDATSLGLERYTEYRSGLGRLR